MNTQSMDRPEFTAALARGGEDRQNVIGALAAYQINQQEGNDTLNADAVNWLIAGVPAPLSRMTDADLVEEATDSGFLNDAADEDAGEE